MDFFTGSRDSCVGASLMGAGQHWTVICWCAGDTARVFPKTASVFTGVTAAHRYGRPALLVENGFALAQ
jgi:hypothetical protein